MSKKERNMSPDTKLGMGEHLAYGIGGGFATNAVNLFIDRKSTRLNSSHA